MEQSNKRQLVRSRWPIRWTRSLKQPSGVPELDLRRVGIFGWSFGGYGGAGAVLRRPDILQVGGGAPVVDRRDYDTCYTERYRDRRRRTKRGMTALHHLRRVGLRRPLLLIHGTSDDNVLFFTV